MRWTKNVLWEVFCHRQLYTFKYKPCLNPNVIYSRITKTLSWRLLQSSRLCSLFNTVCFTARAGQEPSIIDSQHLQQSPGVLLQLTSDPITVCIQLRIICGKAVIALVSTSGTWACSSGRAQLFYCYSGTNLKNYCNLSLNCIV